MLLIQLGPALQAAQGCVRKSWRFRITAARTAEGSKGRDTPLHA